MTLRRPSVLLAALLIAAAVSAPFWANAGIVFLAGLVAVEAVFALSWNLLFGYAGLVSFGHAAFFAVGAYFCGAVLRYLPDVPFPAILAGAAIAGALASALVALLALRRSAGIYFAILTLALGQILFTLIGSSTLLGREDGLSGIPRPVLSLGFVSFDLARGNNYYWFLLIACALLGAVLWWLAHSRVGRVLRSIRQDADRAAFLGIDVHAWRFAAFTIAGAVAALAGALQAPWAQIVTPQVAHWYQSTLPILDTLLGGAGSFWGPVIGAFAFSFIAYGTRHLAGLSELIVGAVLLAVVLLAPGGIAGLLDRFGAAERRKDRHAAPIARPVREGR